MAPRGRYSSSTVPLLLFIVICWWLAPVVNASNEEAGNSGLIDVTDVSESVFRRRQIERRRQRLKASPLPPPTQADDDAEGVNDEFEAAVDADDETATTADRAQSEQEQAEGTTQREPPNKNRSKSRKEKFESNRREYDTQRQNEEAARKKRRDESEHTTAKDGQKQQQHRGASKTPFNPKYPSSSTNVSHMASNIADELTYIISSLRDAAREPRHANDLITPDDGLALTQNPLWKRMHQTMLTFDVGITDPAQLEYAKSFLTSAPRQFKRIVSLTNAAAAKASNQQGRRDAESATEILHDFSTRVEDAKRLYRAHKLLHAAIAQTSLASSVVSGGLAKAQIDLAEELIASIKSEDDIGVKDVQSRQRRKEIKSLHKFVTRQAEAFATARRHAQQVVGGSAVVLPPESVEVAILMNLIARSAPVSEWPVASTGHYSVPPSMYLFGLTMQEIICWLLFMNMIPFHIANVLWTAAKFLRKRFNRWRRSRDGVTQRRSRVLGGRAASQEATTTSSSSSSRIRNIIAKLTLGVFASLCLIYVGLDTPLPSIGPHVTARSILFVLKHFVTGQQAVLVALATLLVHVGQVMLFITP